MTSAVANGGLCLGSKQDFRISHMPLIVFRQPAPSAVVGLKMLMFYVIHLKMSSTYLWLLTGSIFAWCYRSFGKKRNRQVKSRDHGRLPGRCLSPRDFRRARLAML